MTDTYTIVIHTSLSRDTCERVIAQLDPAAEVHAGRLVGEEAAPAPRPYRCTVLVEMPADDGQNLRPEEVVSWLEEHGAQMIQWHDEDLVSSLYGEEDPS